MKSKRKTIIKLQQIVSSGYIPSRSYEKYFGFTQRFEKFEDMTNCFGHAVFNLKNSQFNDIDFTYEDGTNLGAFSTSPFLPIKSVEKEFCEFVYSTGLKIFPEIQKGILKNNEWRVALYFEKKSDDLSREFHWLLQERNGKWSGKMGYSNQVETYFEIPSQIGNYELYKTYLVKNQFTRE